MTENMNFEARLKAFEDIRAIEKLKTKYWRAMDSKNWQQVGECFTEDGTFEVPPRLRTDTGNLKVKGRKAIADFLQMRLTQAITVHQGLAPDIDLTSDATATGKWELHDVIVNERENQILLGWGYYEDEYVKVGSEWKMKSSVLKRKLVEVRNRTTMEKIS